MVEGWEPTSRRRPRTTVNPHGGKVAYPEASLALAAPPGWPGPRLPITSLVASPGASRPFPHVGKRYCPRPTDVLESSFENSNDFEGNHGFETLDDLLRASGKLELVELVERHLVIDTGGKVPGQ